jgi:hypothetical protein
MKVSKTKLNKLQADLKGVSLKPLAEKLNKSEQALYLTLAGKTYTDENMTALIDYRDEVVEARKQLIDRI